jgi:hypothetical protein
MNKDTFTAQLSQAGVGDAGALFRETFRAYTREAILSLVEEEVAALCGNKYDPSSESACYRAGSSSGTVYVNGAQECLKRPRVRELDEHGSAEVSLNTWQAAKDHHPVPVVFTPGCMALELHPCSALSSNAQTE